MANPDSRLSEPPECRQVGPADSTSESRNGELASPTMWLRAHQRESGDLGRAETAPDPVFCRINRFTADKVTGLTRTCLDPLASPGASCRGHNTRPTLNVGPGDADRRIVEPGAAPLIAKAEDNSK
jgi:hypothetical protein